MIQKRPPVKHFQHFLVRSAWQVFIFDHLLKITKSAKTGFKTLGIHDQIEQAPHVAKCALGVGETHPPQNVDILQRSLFQKGKWNTRRLNILRKYSKHCKLATQIDPGILKNDVRRLNPTSSPLALGWDTHRRTRAGRPARLLPPSLAAHAHAQEEKLPVRDGLRPPSLQ